MLGFALSSKVSKMKGERKMEQIDERTEKEKGEGRIEKDERKERRHVFKDAGAASRATGAHRFVVPGGPLTSRYLSASAPPFGWR